MQQAGRGQRHRTKTVVYLIHSQVHAFPVRVLARIQVHLAGNYRIESDYA